MGALLALFRGKDERKPATFGERMLNIGKQHWRGLLAFVWAVVMFGVFFRPRQKDYSTLLSIWLILLGFFLIRPVPVVASALIPIFALPMLGILKSDSVCGNLIDENVMLFFLGNWLLLLVNCCGLDRRLLLLIMSSSKAKAFTPEKMMLKSCLAAFLVSAIAERDLVVKALLHYITDALGPLKGISGESNYGAMTNLLVNAVGVSSYIGSMSIMYSSLTTIQLRSLYCSALPLPNLEFPDTFNFLNYSAYAIPVCIVMFALNTGYEVIMVSRLSRGKISIGSQEILQRSFNKYKQDLGPMTVHEMISVFFLVLMMVLFFTRWSDWLHYGWATHYKLHLQTATLCTIADATVAAIMVVLLNFLPKSVNFLKIWCAKKNKDMPEMKRESGILFWKFVDSHTDYSLFFLFGTGSMLYAAMTTVQEFSPQLKQHLGDHITNLNPKVVVLIIVLVSALLCNVLPAMAAQALLMPIFIIMGQNGLQNWPLRTYLIALAVGLGTSLGFCAPFYHTPNYYVKAIGKLELKHQILYSLASVVICVLVLWVSLCFYAPVLWDPHGFGVMTQKVILPGAVITTPKP